MKTPPTYDELLDLVERMADYDCFLPGTDAEFPCESCLAKAIMARLTLP